VPLPPLPLCPLPSGVEPSVELLEHAPNANMAASVTAPVLVERWNFIQYLSHKLIAGATGAECVITLKVRRVDLGLPRSDQPIVNWYVGRSARSLIAFKG
jgi:hypothetical protein